MQTSHIDPAVLRLYYLQQLGITVYVPRSVGDADANKAIADAVAESVRETPEHPAPPLKAAVDESAVVAAARQRLREIDDELPVAVAGKRSQPAVQAPVAGNSEVTETLAPFQLLFAVLDERIALAVQIPALARSQLGEADARLLGNLLRWLGLSLPAQTWLQFRWPLPGMSAGTVAVAAKTLSVFLQQATGDKQVEHLLLLGQGPGQCVEALGAALPFRVWSTHGLAEMLAVPLLKREAWQQLLPLHELLQKNRG